MLPNLTDEGALPHIPSTMSLAHARWLRCAIAMQATLHVGVKSNATLLGGLYQSLALPNIRLTLHATEMPRASRDSGDGRLSSGGSQEYVPFRSPTSAGSESFHCTTITLRGYWIGVTLGN